MPYTGYTAAPQVTPGQSFRLGASLTPAQAQAQAQAPPTGPLTVGGALLGGGVNTALTGYAYGRTAPGIATAGLQSAEAQRAMALMGAGVAVTAAELQTKAGYTIGQALLGYQGTGLESQLLAGQTATAAAQQGIEAGQYGISQTQYPEQAQQATQAFQLAYQKAQDQGAATGTTNTQGQTRALSELGSQYQWNLADIYRNQSLAALGQQSEELGYATKQAGAANAQQQLALAAQAQGLSVQQLQQQLGFGLSQLGIKATLTSLVSQIAKGQAAGAQGQATLESLLGLAGITTGLGPSPLGTGG